MNIYFFLFICSKIYFQYTHFRYNLLKRVVFLTNLNTKCTDLQSELSDEKDISFLLCLTWLLMDGLVDFPVCPLPYQTLYLPCWWGVREIREFDHFAVLVKNGQHCPTLCYTSARSGKVSGYSWVMVLLITLSWLLAMQSWYCVLLFYINLTIRIQ